MSTCRLLALLFAITFCSPLFAKTSESTSVKLGKKLEYVINKTILTLVTLSSEQPEKAEVILAQSLSKLSHLNIGEQYLLLLSKANIAQFYQQHQQVIILLEQAQLLQKNIAKKQLASPFFVHLDQVLASSLAATKNYEKAFQVQKSFIDDYRDYGDIQRDSIVIELTQKYEITHKNKTNELLDNQNKIKALRLEDVETKQVIQQQNFFLILCTIVIFVLLFFRQLNVRKKLILLTKTDSLTSLTNRTTFFLKGEQLLKSATQQELELSILLFKVDNFKHINNDFGRHVGDLVLIKVARLVDETMRSRDVFARLNDEEFVAILPSTDIDSAKAIAMRVIEKVAEHGFSQKGLDKKISLSIGVANNYSTNTTLDELLHAADFAMSQASSQGQNQMVSYNVIAKNR